MSTRKSFLAGAAGIPLVAAASPAPSPSPKVSEPARALAARMRGFDAELSGEEIEKIAAGIDENLKAGSRINPHGTALKNWDEPAAIFAVPE